MSKTRWITTILGIITVCMPLVMLMLGPSLEEALGGFLPAAILLGIMMILTFAGFLIGLQSLVNRDFQKMQRK